MHLRALHTSVSTLVAIAIISWGCTSDLPAPDLYPTRTDAGDEGTPGQLELSCGELPRTAVGASFVFTPQFMGGDGTYRFAADDLPAGLAINETSGQISGIPATEGDLAFEIVVTDGTGATAQDTCEIAIHPALSVDLSLDAVPYCATGGQTLLEFVVAGTGDGTPITCEHVAGSGNGRTPEGITIDANSCEIVGRVTEERLGTWAFMVRGAQSGAEVWLPYCVTQDEGSVYAVTVEHTAEGVDNTLVPFMRTYDLDAPLDVGGGGDPYFEITHPESCGNQSCFYGYAFGINSSPFEIDTLSLAPVALINDPLPPQRPIGFSHELAIAGPPVESSFRDRPWVVNIDLDYCLSADSSSCEGVDNIRENGNGNLQFSIIMVPQ